MTKQLPPIAQGWQFILDRAPTEEDRERAESWRTLFYAGAHWVWDVFTSLDDEDDLLEFCEAIETELAAHREEMKQRHMAMKGHLQ